MCAQAAGGLPLLVRDLGDWRGGGALEGCARDVAGFATDVPEGLPLERTEPLLAVGGLWTTPGETLGGIAIGEVALVPGTAGEASW
jgi:hypothetical protein